MPLIIGVNFHPVYVSGPDHFWGMVGSKHWWTGSPYQVLASWRNHAEYLDHNHNPKPNRNVTWSELSPKSYRFFVANVPPNFVKISLVVLA